MKNVRLFYKKSGRACYIAHLDTMRAMTRLIRRAGLPVWYTEGFNPHLYITFAMPLPLGMASDYEVADIRLTDDGYDIKNICDLLNKNAPEGFSFFAAKDPVKKLSALCFASFRAEFEPDGVSPAALEKFLSSPEITVSKRTKRGDIKELDVAPDIKDFKVENNGGTRLFITLPASPAKTVNPELIINKFLAENGECYCKITRTGLFDETLAPLE